MNDEIKYDVRLVRHHMRRNNLDQKEYETHLDGLDDVAEGGESTTTRFLGTVESRRKSEPASAE